MLLQTSLHILERCVQLNQKLTTSRRLWKLLKTNLNYHFQLILQTHPPGTCNLGLVKQISIL